MDFKDELKEYQKLVNDELEKYLRKDDCYEKRLNDAMEYSLMAGGKRLRAILVIDTYKLFRDDYEKCLPFAIALEMIHNCSLIHDDLPEIDNDDFRHGKPTNHKQFGHATALLAGDGLLNYSYVVLSNELLKTIRRTGYVSVSPPDRSKDGIRSSRSSSNWLMDMRTLHASETGLFTYLISGKSLPTIYSRIL